jgi:hypothetical protein
MDAAKLLKLTRVVNDNSRCCFDCRGWLLAPNAMRRRSEEVNYLEERNYDLFGGSMAVFTVIN